MGKKQNELWEWIKSIIIAVIIALLIRGYVVETFLVDGESMVPTLKNYERLIVNKFVYRFSEPEHGDVIVFKYSPDRDFIKRVIATGGDTVRVNGERVYLNGIPLEEDYILEYPYGDYGPVVVPEGHYFVLGDNRNNSWDSREPSVGFVSPERIKGKAFLVYWPLDNFRLLH